MGENNRRLFIGNAYGAPGDTIAFLSTRNFNEASIIFLTHLSLVGEVVKPGHAVPWTTFSRLKDRLAELSDWIARGHTLVVFGAHSVPFTYVTQQNMGTTTRLEEMSPLDQISFAAASGAHVE